MSNRLRANQKLNPSGAPNWRFNEVSPSARMTMGSDNIPGAGDVSDAIENNKTAVKKGGLVNHLKTDLGHGGDFISNVSSALGSSKGAVNELTGKPVNATQDIKKAGSDLLEGLGRGNKTFGAAKVGGYMLGTAMLVDMLNPFDAD